MNTKTLSLGDRMKDYENSFRFHLPKRMPVIIRIDGCHFHTFTRGMCKPYDERLNDTFVETCEELVSSIAGCKLAYHQSDEISLLLVNYTTLNTQAWFNNNLQKLVSVTASMTSSIFNRIMARDGWAGDYAVFDARAFVLPKEEVNNYFLWRQQDATKNSILNHAQSLFGQKQIEGINTKKLQEMMLLEKDFNWNNIDTWKKRGACVIRKQQQRTFFESKDAESNEKLLVEFDEKVASWINPETNSRIVVDKEIPIFSSDKSYIESLVDL